MQILQQPFEGEGLSVRLDLTVREARSLAASSPQNPIDLSGWIDRCTQALDDWNDEFEKARANLDLQDKVNWDKWQAEALSGSARRMHKPTRDTNRWMPTVAETVPGVVTSDPRKMLANEATASRTRPPRLKS